MKNEDAASFQYKMRLRPGFLSVDEFRADKLNLEGYPDHIASTGFAALALVFHPTCAAISNVL
jgi:hypothetical protein